MRLLYYNTVYFLYKLLHDLSKVNIFSKLKEQILNFHERFFIPMKRLHLAYDTDIHILKNKVILIYATKSLCSSIFSHIKYHHSKSGVSLTKNRGYIS